MMAPLMTVDAGEGRGESQQEKLGEEPLLQQTQGQLRQVKRSLAIDQFIFYVMYQNY